MNVLSFLLCIILFHGLSFLYIFSLRKSNIEHFNNSPSFDVVLDNVCSSMDATHNQYHNGQCVESSCELETCVTLDGQTVDSKKDFVNGSCVSKASTHSGIYTSCSQYVPPPVVYQPPVVQQPQITQQPSYQPQMMQQPSYQQPSYQQPSYQQPSYQPQMMQQPSYQPQMIQQPSYQQPSYQPPVQQPTPPTYNLNIASPPPPQVLGFTTTSAEPVPAQTFSMVNNLDNCAEDEYWNSDNNECSRCGENYILKNRNATTSSRACEEIVDCTERKIKCYTSPDCDVEFKDMTRDDDANICIKPDDCTISCTGSILRKCGLNPRLPCVHPDDKTFTKYEYDEDCVLRSVENNDRTIEKCTGCRPYIDEEGNRIRRRIRRVDGVLKCLDV